MKAIIVILFIFPVFCFAQEEKSKTNVPVKPSTTDCPTWKKKSKKNSKAAYFQSLRSNKTKANQQTSYSDYSTIQPNSAPQKTENSIQKINVKETQEIRNTEKTTVLKTNNENSSTTVSSKNNTSNSSLEENSINTTESEIKKVKEPDTDVTKKEDKKTEKSEKDKREDSKIKKKLDRMTRKTTKVGRHSNAKCPSF